MTNPTFPPRRVGAALFVSSSLVLAAAANAGPMKQEVSAATEVTPQQIERARKPFIDGSVTNRGGVVFEGTIRFDGADPAGVTLELGETTFLRYGSEAYRVDLHNQLACPLARFVSRGGVVAYTEPAASPEDVARGVDGVVPAPDGRGFVAPEFASRFLYLMRKADYGQVGGESPDLASLRKRLNRMNLEQFEGAGQRAGGTGKLAAAFDYLDEAGASEDLQALAGDYRNAHDKSVAAAPGSLDKKNVRVQAGEALQAFHESKDALARKHGFNNGGEVMDMVERGSYMNSDALVTYEAHLLEDDGDRVVGIAGVPLRLYWDRLKGYDLARIEAIKPHATDWDEDAALAQSMGYTQYDIVNTYQVAALLRHFHERDPAHFSSMVATACPVAGPDS